MYVSLAEPVRGNISFYYFKDFLYVKVGLHSVLFTKVVILIVFTCRYLDS